MRALPNEVVKLKFLECKNFQVRNVKGAVEGRGGSEGGKNLKNMKNVENMNLTNMFENTKASKHRFNCVQLYML